MSAIATCVGLPHLLRPNDRQKSFKADRCALGKELTQVAAFPGKTTYAALSPFNDANQRVVHHPVGRRPTCERWHGWGRMRGYCCAVDGARKTEDLEEPVMSDMVKFGIVAASLCVTVTLMWGVANLAVLSTLWSGEHLEAAKAVRLLPVFVLPIVAVTIHRRRSRASL